MPREAQEWDSEKNFVVDSNGDVKPAPDFFDDDGELHDAPDERVLGAVHVTDERLIHASASAAMRAMDHEIGRNPHWPMTVEDVIAERVAKKARATPLFERDDPYASLGGGLPANREVQLSRDEILEDVLEAFEPWHVDVRAAVERFGVVDYTLGALKEMEKFDEYSLHFYGFMQQVESDIRLIELHGGRTDLEETLHDRYDGHSVEEMRAYARRLQWLEDDLDATGIPQAVLAHLETSYGKLEGWKDVYSTDEVVRRHRIKATDVLTKFRRSHKLHTPQITKNSKGKPKLEFTQ